MSSQTPVRPAWRDFLNLIAPLLVVVFLAVVAAGVIAVVAGIADLASAAGRVPEPRTIQLVSSRSGEALTGLHWSSPAAAAGRLVLTGEGAADLGRVHVRVTRDHGRITAVTWTLPVAGLTNSWAYSRGSWHVTSDPVAADGRLCRWFPEFGSSPAAAVRSEDRWSAHIAGTDSGMARDARRLAAYADAHPHAHQTGGRWLAVYLDCNPDA